ncbi:hypothetical protein Tco_1297028 [Tanacetum coccineum]
MSTKAVVVKYDGHNKHHMFGDAACSKHTASNTELESEIEIIPDMSDIMTANNLRWESVGFCPINASIRGWQGLPSGYVLWNRITNYYSRLAGTTFWDVSAVSGQYLSIDFEVSDAKGQRIHCSARASVAHNFLRLREEGIYSVKIFAVKPNKEEYQVIKDDNFMLELDGSTNFRKVSVKADGFVRYPLKLVDLDVIEPFLRQRAVNQSNAMGKPQGDKVYLLSTSSIMILDDVEIPAIKALKDANSGTELKNPYMPIDLTQPVKRTIENLPMWARNKKNNSATFHCTMTIDGVRTKTGWNFPSRVDFPMLRYRLELDVSVDTTQTVIAIFDEIATALVGCSARSLIDIKDEVFVCGMFNWIENIFALIFVYSP